MFEQVSLKFSEQFFLSKLSLQVSVRNFSAHISLLQALCVSAAQISLLEFVYFFCTQVLDTIFSAQDIDASSPGKLSVNVSLRVQGPCASFFAQALCTTMFAQIARSHRSPRKYRKELQNTPVFSH